MSALELAAVALNPVAQSLATESVKGIRRRRGRRTNPEAARKYLVQQLQDVWSGMGFPPPTELAQRTQQRVSLFEFLVDDAAHPNWDQVQAVLTAAGVYERVAPQYLQMWKQAQPLPDMPPAPGAEQRAGTGSAGLGLGVLNAAMRARTREEFVEQLGKLRTSMGRSFGDIAKNSRLAKATAHWMVQPGNFPRRKEQVLEFTRACGCTPTETNLWAQQWERLRWAPLPEPGVSSARLVNQANDGFDAEGFVQRVTDVLHKVVPGGVDQYSDGDLEVIASKLMQDISDDLVSCMTDSRMPDDTASASRQKALQRRVIALVAACAAVSEVRNPLPAGKKTSGRPS